MPHCSARWSSSSLSVVLSEMVKGFLLSAFFGAPRLLEVPGIG